MKSQKVMLAAAMMSGLLGGLSANWFLSPSVVIAAGSERPQKTIRAERFEVTGKDGKVRGTFDVDRENNVSVTLLDSENKERLWLAVPAFSNCPMLWMKDKDGKIRAAVQLREDGGGFIRVNKGDGTPSVSMMANSDNSPAMVFVTKEGKIVQLP